MKKYIYILFSLLMMPMLSCEDKLDVDLFNTLDSKTAIRTVDDLELILLSAYGELRANGLYSKAFVYLPDLMADNIRLGDISGTNSSQANWQYSADDEILVWASAYSLTYHVSILLSNADKFEDSPKKNRVVGQALALRALAHFDLLRYYGESYDRNFDKVQSGIPLVTLFSLDAPVRNTVKEVYDQIFEDLLTARTMLSDVDKDTQEDGPYFMNELAVNALLARVSLYAGQWQEAVDYASNVIDVSSLSGSDEYETMWSEDTDGEVLFAVWFSEPGEGLVGAAFNENAFTLTLTADMAELYDAANDIRYNSFVKLNTGTFIDDKYLVQKYPGRSDEIGFNNAKVLRVSEMYLIRAEAYTNISGQESLGLADLNTLRANRITGYVDEELSGEALVDAIAAERRKELVAEGHRWFDLRRTGKPVVRGVDCKGLTNQCMLEANDFRFAYPLPIDEILANPAIRQNDGY